MNILDLVAGISLDSSEMEEGLESLATRAVAKGKLIADAIGTVASKGFDLLKGAITSSVDTGICRLIPQYPKLLLQRVKR